MTNDPNINEQLRAALAAFETGPRQPSFDAVMEKLEKKKKRRAFWLFFTGLVAVGSLLYPLVIALSPQHHDRQAEYVRSADHIIPSETTLQDRQEQSERTKAPGPSASVSSPRSRPSAPASVSPPAAQVVTHNAAGSPAAASGGPLRAPASLSIPGHDPGDKLLSALQDDVPVYQSNGEIKKDSSWLYLNPKQVILSAKPTLDSLDPVIADVPGPGLNLRLKTRPSFSLLLGLSITPQLISYQHSKNRKYRYDYNTGAFSAVSYDLRENYPDLYLKNKKEQNRFYYTNALSLKLGLVFDNTWELWLSAGRQVLKYDEKFYLLASDTVTQAGPVYPSVRNGFVSFQSTDAAVHNAFNYLFGSMEVNRLFHLYHSLSLKPGLGFSVSRLVWASYGYVKAVDRYEFGDAESAYISKTLYTISASCGVIQPLGKRFQLRFSPGVFYSPASMFDKGYVIRQRPLGFQAELSLAFRVF